MLYRKQRRPTSVWLPLGAGLLGLLLGFLGGRSSAPQPSIQTLLEPAALHLRRASGALDIVALEYVRARQGRAESQAASTSAAREVRQQLRQATALRSLYPEQFQTTEQTASQLETAVTQRQPAATVRSLVERLQPELQRLSGLGGPSAGSQLP